MALNLQRLESDRFDEIDDINLINRTHRSAQRPIFYTCH